MGVALQYSTLAISNSLPKKPSEIITLALNSQQSSFSITEPDQLNFDWGRAALCIQRSHAGLLKALPKVWSLIQNSNETSQSLSESMSGDNSSIKAAVIHFRNIIETKRISEKT